MRPLAQILLLALAACGGPAAAPDRGPAPGPPRGSDRFADRRAADGRSAFAFPEGPEERATRPDGYSPVARLQWIAPRGPGLLRATLPVPDGFEALEAGRTPLAVALRGGPPVPAQVHALTRAVDGRAQVVLLTAALDPPPEARPGQRLGVDVLAGDWALPSERPWVPPTLAGPATVRLRTRDVHGNVYVADLTGAPKSPGSGSLRVLEDGPVQRVLRSHSTLMPVEPSGSGRARPHLMGIHAYWTLRAGDPRVGLDLRIHNGATSGSRSPSAEELPLGVVHWDALELLLPPGWRADALVDDPFLGRGATAEGGTWVLPLVEAHEEGELHMMPPQAQLHRRLTLRPTSEAPGRHLALEGLAFARPGAGLWSWSNPDTARYFPLQALLPDWSPLRASGRRGEDALRARLARRRDTLRATLESGLPQGDLLAGTVMGWSHPLGVSTQGMTGGSGIDYVEGHRALGCASPQGVEALMLEHRMNASRQPQAAYDRAGDFVGVEAWLDEQGRVPFDFRTNGRMVPPCFRLPMHGGPPPDHQVRAVHLAERRPAYDQGTPHRSPGRLAERFNDLYSWMPHDGQHYARWTHLPMALAWVAGDALAIDDVHQAAETFHLMFHGEEHVEVSWSPGVTLRALEELAEAHPHHGLPVGRDQAWGIDVMCAAWLLADDDWRARRGEWFERVGQLLVDGAMPSGLVQRRQEPKLLDGAHAGGQAFETLFLLHAKRCLVESVLADRAPELADELQAVHQRALDYLFWGPLWDCVQDETGPLCGPRWHFATAPRDDWSAAPYSDEGAYGARYLPHDGLSGPVDTTYVWGPLEYGMLVARGDRGPSLDDRYLRRALSCDRAAGRWDVLVQQRFATAKRDGSDLSGSWASLVARVQSLRIGRQR